MEERLQIYGIWNFFNQMRIGRLHRASADDTTGMAM